MAAKELVEFVAKKLVTHPESVQVRLIEGDDGQTIQLTVAEADMGCIIGKNGRTAKALRTLLYAAATKSQTQVGLEIVNASQE
jgi:uncharacterized protein